MAGPLQTTMFNGVSDFYNGVATQSLRFAYTSAETWLARTPDAGNRKTHTLSVWVKRSGISASQNILEARGSGDAGNTDIWFDANDKLEVSGASTYFRVTTQRFRDVNSWYHLVFRFDTTQGTANNRLLIYVNGSVVTDFDTNNNYSQNTDYGIGGNVEHRIGDGYGHFDGYMARYEFIDGLSLGPENFGETKNGIWVAKAYGGSYGTNGHKLEFKETGTDADANGLGADTSGNNNHYTPTAILGHDSAFPDCPENNFATLLGESSESSDYQSYANGTYYEGNLNVKGVGGWTNGKSNFLVNSGKWYVECRVNAWQANNYIRLGVFARPARTYDEYFILGNGTGQIDGTARNVVSSFSTGVIIQIALDLENNNIFFGIDNTWSNSATASEIVAGTATNAFASGSQVPTGDGHNYGFYFNPHTATTNITVNFGQDSSFGGVETATTNTDSEGFGTFQYEPPAGFLAMCSANITKPTIGPDSVTQATDHFNTVIYSGNDDATRTFNIGFPPDWTWFKVRNQSGYGHQLYDSSRGVHKYLQSNVAGTEQTSTEGVTSFDTSGNLVIGTNAFLNEDGSNGTIWNWKANNGTTTTNDASATSVGTIDSVYQANTTAGFSIVQFEATGSAGTIAHGLSQAPNFMILKSRDQNGAQWMVYYGDNTDYLVLQGTDATTDGQSTWNDTSPTSTVFSVGVNGGDSNNSSGGSMIGYIFHDVEGYSKFGSYTGNGNNNGTVVFTGFRPAFIMTKRVNSTSNWVIQDSVRQTINPMDAWLRPNTNDAEGTTSPDLDVDFVSNGFKIRNNGTDNNINGSTYIYMAFAEAPFKYANAR